MPLKRELRFCKENPYLFSLSHDERIVFSEIRHEKVKNYMLLHTVNEEARTISIIRML